MRAPSDALSRLVVPLALCAAILAALPRPADAQYFGRNRVQYETFDFQVLKTEHFDVYYYPEEAAAARDAARMAERWYARFSQVLGHEFEDRQSLIIYANSGDFRQTVITEVGQGTLGVTDFLKSRIALYIQPTYEETDHLVGHELVHAFQFDIAGIGNNPAGLEAAARRFQVPLWFVEGMAEYLSGGPVDYNAAMVLRDAALDGRIPTVEELTRDGRYFPYTWGHAFWAYVGGRWGDAAIGQILKQVGAGVPYQLAFQRIINTSLEDVSEEWAASIRQAYLPLLTQQAEAREIARPLVTEETEGGRLNLGPVLSPDGKLLAFLSSRDDFDVALYLADAETGEVIRTLQKGTAFDAHFSSLNFINSAGTWAPDGERFAFSASRGGTEVIFTLDARSGRRIREYEPGAVEEISTPTWSPDGRTIVFSGMEGGFSNLYALDLESGQTRQLTDDPFADLHPAFAPDGRTVAFVTDRGRGAEGTNLASLQYGTYQIALLDVATGAIRFLPRMEGEKNINPVWARDGRSIFFVSNRSGIPNVYRLTLDGARLTQVTNLFTGISGITELSPVISGARDTDRLVFTSYERFGYNIYALDDASRLAGVPVPPVQIAERAVTPAPAFLPPVPRPVDPAFNRVANLIADPDFGLPPAPLDTAYTVAPYRPSLALDYLGQPQVGFSTGGAFSRGGVYGGISAIFSDELAYHNIYAAIQAQGQLDEIGGSVLYINRKYRYNWGAAAQRIPYIRTFIAQGQDAENPSLFRRQLVDRRIFDSSIQGLAQYPFSQVQRAEFSVGARRLSGDVQIREDVFQIIGNQIGPLVERNEFEDEQSQFGVNLVETSVALVYDNSLSGYTSPFAGQRYRFELTPTAGDLTFLQALGDYRKYFLMRPFTFAVQGLHYGRYGFDSETLFGDQFLGYPYLVRGYEYGSIRDECVEQRTGCDLIARDGQLFGSRIGVVKAELRIPFFRQVAASGGLAIPPIEGLAFFDAGVAWGRDSDPVFATGVQDNPAERGIVTSAGVGARVNLFGFFVVEVDYAKAFERDRGWHWIFALQPGF